MRAFGLILARSDGFLVHILVKLSLEMMESNSNSITGQLKIETLQIACDEGGSLLLLGCSWSH
jgi:hypothetical protein